MRGEQQHWQWRCSISVGSPPLARGTEQAKNNPLSQGRITPACAGNRGKAVHQHRAHEDHPRLRGEQPLQPSLWLCRIGSPPLARGTVRPRRKNEKSNGITPACAGNSIPAGICVISSRDHPRLRGEQFIIPKCAFGIAGSPPLARGTD